MFLWALATLVICASLAIGVGFLAWTGGTRLWRRLHYWDRMVRPCYRRFWTLRSGQDPSVRH